MALQLFYGNRDSPLATSNYAGIVIFCTDLILACRATSRPFLLPFYSKRLRDDDRSKRV